MYPFFKKFDNNFYDITIFDEVHYLKSSQSRRGNFFLKEFSNTKKRMGLTGTPFGNSIVDLYNILYTVNRKFMRSQMTLFNFMEEYSKNKTTDRYTGKDKYHGIKNATELLDIFSPIMLRRLKKDVEASLPPLIYDFVPIDGGVQKDQVKSDEIAEKIVKGEALNAEEVIWLDNLRIVNLKHKIPKVLEMVENYEGTGVKILITTHHIKSREYLKDALLKKKVKFFSIESSMTLEQRAEAIAEAKGYDSECVVLSTTKTVSTGLDLQFCSLTIIAEIDYVLIDFEQLASRTHRIGQKSNKVVVYVPYFKKGIEKNIALHIKDKLNDFKECVGSSGGV